jgi:hypothetical protein
MLTLSAWAGYLSGISWWLLAPGLFFGVLLVGEARQWILRRRWRASPPVEVSGPAVSLGRPFTTCDLVMRRYETELAGYRGARLRVAHVSDFHVTDRLRQEYYVEAMERAAGIGADLLFLTGDLVSHREHIPLLPPILARARARRGVFAILGNHDHWADAEEISRLLTEAGVELLGGRTKTLRMEGDATVVLAGWEYPWGPADRQAPAAQGGHPLIVLTHTADNVFDCARAGAAAMFAGHYHGGQGKVPWFGAVVVPSRYGRLLDHGHFRINGTHLFVTSGVGVGAPTLRVYCRPEVLVVDFQGRKA